MKGFIYNEADPDIKEAWIITRWQWRGDITQYLTPEIGPERRLELASFTMAIDLGLLTLNVRRRSIRLLRWRGCTHRIFIMEISKRYDHRSFWMWYTEPNSNVCQENTLISDSGKAMLCDFGLAKIVATTTGLTAPGPPKSTPRYASPELFKGEMTDDPLPRDVWAWGCLLPKVSHRVPRVPARFTDIPGLGDDGYQTSR